MNMIKFDSNLQDMFLDKSIECIEHIQEKIIFDNTVYGISHCIKNVEICSYLLKCNNIIFTHETLGYRPDNKNIDHKQIKPLSIKKLNKVFNFCYVRSNNYQMFFVYLFPKLYILDILMQTRWKDETVINILIDGKMLHPYFTPKWNGSIRKN